MNKRPNNIQVQTAYERYDSDPRSSGVDDYEAFCDALEPLQRALEGIAGLPDLNGAHFIDIRVTQDGRETWYEGDWLKTLQQTGGMIGQEAKSE